MDVIAEIRRRHFVEHETITFLTKIFKLSRPTIRKHFKTIEKPVFLRKHPSYLKRDQFQEALDAWLEKENSLSRKQQRTAQRLYEF